MNNYFFLCSIPGHALDLLRSSEFVGKRLSCDGLVIMLLFSTPRRTAIHVDCYIISRRYVHAVAREYLAVKCSTGFE